MARNRGIRQNFNFVKGWNTEASPMTFPENTAKDLDNVILDIDGSIRRRPGVNFDDVDASFADTTTTSRFSSEAIGFFEWLNVSGIGTLAFTVTQFGTILYFHRQAGPETVNNLIGTVDFSSFAINVSEAKKSVVAVDSGLGYLFVVGSFIEPFYIEYDTSAGTLTATQIDIQIRDFDGLDDSLDISERPATLSDEHRYNLLNQGWVEDFQRLDLTDAAGNPIEETKRVLDVYPSNADILSFGKVTSSSDADDIGSYSPRELNKILFGNTPAPKGHFILSAFDKQRGTASGVSVPAETLNNRPNAVAFHNGRAFFAGLTKVGRTGEVYFSQQLINIDKVGLCYQEQDPTAEDLNALVETDGGVITIPNAGTILSIAESAAGVVVFATNGIWEISGTDGKFSATSFYIRKVTDIPISGRETVVNADGTFLFWSDAGIIALVRDNVSGTLTAENISKNTIQTGYLLIGGVQRKFARGTYITEEKKAVWLYNTNTSYDGITDRWKCNGVLILDTQLGAFYKYSVSDLNAGAAPYISGIIKTNPFVSTEIQENVTENGVIVTENGVNVTVGVEAFDGDAEISSWKLLCVRRTFGSGGTSLGLAFGEFNSRTWTDWYLSDGVGVDYTSFLETGYSHEGNPMQDKKPTYVFAYFSPKSKSLLSGSYYELPPIQEFFCGDLSTMAYTGNSLTHANLTEPYDSEVSADGTQLYVVNLVSASAVYQFTMSTPFDLSTATYGGKFKDVSAEVGSSNAHSITFGNNFSKMYITESSDGPTVETRQYTLSTPGDVSTASYDSKFFASAQDTGMFAVELNSNGTKMIGVGDTNNKLFQYTLSTAFDISTASYDSVSFDFSAQVTDPHNLYINDAGTRLYILGVSGNTVYQYNFGTPYDLSTLVYSGITFSASAQATETHGFALGNNGNTAYIADAASNAIYEYELDCS